MSIVVVGITGGSGSGKSTLANILGGLYPSVIVSQDRYYLGLPPGQSPEAYNFDHPDALDLLRLSHDLDSLKRGERTEVPVYDFGLHRRLDASDLLPPAPLVIAEGHLLWTRPELRDLFDMKIFIRAETGTRLARRVARDAIQRGRTEEDVRRQFTEQVEPMHVAFVAPAENSADYVFENEQDDRGPFMAQVDEVTTLLERLMDTV